MKNAVIKGANAQKVEKKGSAVLNVVPTAPQEENAIVAEEKVTPVQEEVAQSVSEKEEAKSLIKNFAPSAEERIKNIKNFEILSTRFLFLKEKADDLKRFKMENAGTEAQLILKNQSGFEFKVSNSSVIGKALAVVAEELMIMVNDTENEILNYVI